MAATATDDGTGMALFLGAVRGEFETLLARGIPCGALLDVNTKLKLGDLSAFRVVEPFDYTRPKAELVGRIQDIRSRHGLGCLINLVEQYVAHFAHAARELGLPAVSPESAALCIDKYAMKRRFVDRIGPGCVPPYMTITGDADRRRFGQLAPFPHIWKPVNLTSSLFVNLCQTEDQEAGTYRTLLERVPGYYAQSGQTDKPFGLMVEGFVSGPNWYRSTLSHPGGDVTLLLPRVRTRHGAVLRRDRGPPKPVQPVPGGRRPRRRVVHRPDLHPLRGVHRHGVGRAVLSDDLPTAGVRELRFGDEYGRGRVGAGEDRAQHAAGGQL